MCGNFQKITCLGFPMMYFAEGGGGVGGGLGVGVLCNDVCALREQGQVQLGLYCLGGPVQSCLSFLGDRVLCSEVCPVWPFYSGVYPV